MSRKYGISPVMIGRWKREYSSGKFFENTNNFDIASLKIRISELERLVGELLLENKMLKKAKELDTIQKKDDLPVITSSSAKQLKDGARQWVYKDHPTTTSPGKGPSLTCI